MDSSRASGYLLIEHLQNLPLSGSAPSSAEKPAPAGTVTERTISLPGGVLVTKRGTTASDVWSYPNIHGDIVATTNGSGIKAGATRGYDPFGNLLGTSTTPDNSAGPFDYGWHGSAQRPLEYSSGFTPLIEMGARQYSSLLGRFLEVDPILGGNANDYAYVSDPVGMSDLDGLCGVWGNPRTKCGKRRKGQRGFLGGAFSKGGRAARVGITAAPTSLGTTWARMNGGSCRWNGTRWMNVCTGMSRGYGPQRGFTMGSTYLGGRGKADDRLIRHEAKHANQWAWFGGGAVFPLVYAVSPRTWESQAGLSDGCYQKPSRDGC